MRMSLKSIGVLGAVLGISGMGWHYLTHPTFGPSSVYAQQAAEALQAKGNVLAQADQLSAAFRDVAKTMKPSVVKISATIGPKDVKTTNAKRQGRPNIPPELRGFEQFFGEGFDMDQFEEQEQPRGESQGSGFIVSTDGYILTNNHVINNASSVKVVLSDNRSFDAKIVGADSDSDIAVLKIEASGLVASSLGDSDAMQVGDWVVAIGSPFGLSQTVTSGIVSAVNRDSVGDGNITSYDDFIQTDAAINPGNSGGPLLNLKGEVIGINTAIASKTGTFGGVGFAIPSNMAKDALQDIIKTGHVVRGFIGARLNDLSPEQAEHWGLDKNSQGALIEKVFNGGPAAKAKLQPGDFVIRLNSQPITNRQQLRLKVAAMSPGDKAVMEVVRNGKPVTITVIIEEQTAERLAEMSERKIIKSLDIEVQPMTPEAAQILGLESDEGVLVTQVNPQGKLAGKIGRGEAILAINRTPITSVDDIEAALKKSKGVTSIEIHNPTSTRLLTIRGQ